MLHVRPSRSVSLLASLVMSVSMSITAVRGHTPADPDMPETHITADAATTTAAAAAARTIRGASQLSAAELLLETDLMVNESEATTTSLATFLQTLLGRDDFGLPPAQNGPVNVAIELVIGHLLGLNEVKMDFTMDVVLRQYWIDPRLSFAEHLPHVGSLGIPDQYYQNVWLPDTAVENGKEGEIHDITMPNKMFRIYRNATIVYSQRLKLDVWCPMYLALFPLDRQYCDVQLASYRYTNEEVNIVWKPDGSAVYTDGLNANEMSMFKLTGVVLGNCTFEAITGVFSCINFTLGFDRQFGYYLIQVYVPSILIVMLSWVSFWLEPNAVPARISLGILTLLAMTNQMSATSSDAAPRVSYVKGLDVWLTSCMAFLTLAMLEYAFVTTLVQEKQHDLGETSSSGENTKDNSYQNDRVCVIDNADWKKNNMASSFQVSSRASTSKHYTVTSLDKSTTEHGRGEVIEYSNKTTTCCRFRVRDPLLFAYKIDRISRFAFPLFFALFNACYWLLYGYLLQQAQFE